MASPLPFLLLLFISLPFTESQLSIDFYKTTCPDYEKIIRETVISKQTVSPATAAATLRLFFHDCMVEGCDASVFITSNSFNRAERDEEINHSLSGDAFDVVVRAKTALELSCPGIVSCADILASTTRDLIKMVGGPYYAIGLGRKDGLVSLGSHVEGNLPRVNMTMGRIIDMFAKKNFTIQEMVALTGGHTIGFSHCSEFSDRLYSHSKTSPIDPDLNPKYAEGLQKLCKDYKTNSAIAAFNDVMTPGKFDNMYYKNLPRGLGLLSTDSVMYKDPRTRPMVELYALNQTAFFNDFARAMEKLSVYQIKTGKDGEVRHRCDLFNSLNA